MHSIHKPSNVDVSKFTFGDIQVNQYGGKSCKIKYDGKDFLFQTPRMRLPYGLGIYEEKDGDGNTIKSKYSLDFSFTGYDDDKEDGTPSRPKVKALYDMMKSLEERLVNETVENSYDWLGADDLNESAAKCLTRDIVKYHRDKQTKKRTNKYPPTFKAKVGFYDGRFTVNAFNESKEPITDLAENCPKRTEAVAIVKLERLTFAGGKCGYSFRVYQIKLYLPATMPSYAFIEDDDDETPVVSAPVDIAPSTTPSPTSSNSAPQLVEDSDEDEDEDDLDLDDESEDEVEEVVAPPPKKKTVRKKKVSKRSNS